MSNTTSKAKPFRLNLIEMLVVCTVAAATMAALAPVVASARTVTQSPGTMSQVRDSLRASALYSVDYDEASFASCVVNDAAFNSQDGGCKDLASGRVWSSSTDIAITWDAANTHCSGLVEGGMSDWRMPSISELQTVGANGGLSHLYMPDPYVNRWSSTKKGVDAWGYNFESGASALFGTKPGSKNGWWILRVVCTR